MHPDAECLRKLVAVMKMKNKVYPVIIFEALVIFKSTRSVYSHHMVFSDAEVLSPSIHPSVILPLYPVVLWGSAGTYLQHT